VSITGEEQTDNDTKEKSSRYKYIGYTQDFPADQYKYESMQPDLLMKLARESVRKRDFYSAIRYLNVILMKNPNHHAARFYKKEVMMILDRMKQRRDVEKARAESA
jgi:hypothetical protein